jgi:hypothetical protein
VGLGVCRAASAITTLPIVISPGTSETWDGWNITAPSDATVTILSESNNGGQLNIEKDASFTAAGQVVPVSFQHVSSGASVIDVVDESIFNDSSSQFNGFQFLLTGGTFPSVSDAFGPPTGTGYNFSSVTLTSADTAGDKDELTYTGTQNAGTTSLWGKTGIADTLASAESDGNVDDNLFIDAPVGADFVLKEISSIGGGSGGNGGGGGSNGGGGGSGSSAVPMPAAVWQSLAGLAGLALYGIARKLKHRPA